MGSANKTANYGLNQWQGNEYPKMDDFNADNAAIDVALKANADATQKIIAGTTKVGDASQADNAAHASSADNATSAGTAATAAGYSSGGGIDTALQGKAAQSDMTAAQAAIASNTTALQGKAALSTSVSATLTAAGWTGSVAPYTQTVAVAGLGANQNGHTQIADGTTPAQRAAARYANMAKTAQAAGSITITADGTKPSIDIPITIVLEG